VRPTDAVLAATVVVAYGTANRKPGDE